MAKPKATNARDQRKYRERKRRNGLCAYAGCNAESKGYYCRFHREERSLRRMIDRARKG